MDAARIQNRLYKGYGKASKRLGFTYTQYRPKFAKRPFQQSNIIGAFPATFSPAGQVEFPFNKPSDYKSITWSGLFDATGVQSGDYLLCDDKPTYFVAATQHLLPPLCVECSRTFAVIRPTIPQTGIGLQPYSGVQSDDETTLVEDFPGAMQWSREGGRPYLDIPSDSPKKIGWLIFLPVLPEGIIIQERDFIEDDLGRRFLAMGIYLTDLGYRIAAELMQA